ncbi:MAG TPA: hypothetical protein VH140_08345, partial [Candidatus Acidoferrum sp.]|nr:hypothetical protein [Candidatus Acidoferrum sp.]
LGSCEAFSVTDFLLFVVIAALHEHASQNVHQIDNLALPLHVKLYFKISLGRVINRLLQAQKWLDDLARQDIADPNADEQGHD